MTLTQHKVRRFVPSTGCSTRVVEDDSSCSGCGGGGARLLGRQLPSDVREPQFDS